MNQVMNTEKLGDLISLVGGGTPSKDNDDYWSDEIPWATVKDLKSDVLKSTKDHISKLGLVKSSSKIIEAGSIIIATRMAVGRVVITESDVAINQDLKGISCSDKIDTKFLYYFLSSQVNYFNRVSSGATVKGIKIAHITEIEIPLPPLAEQQKIAEILDAADALRQKDRQLIDHYSALSQSLFLEMFGDPLYNMKMFERKPIGDVIKIQGGSQPPKTVFINEPSEGYVRLIQIRDYKSDKYLTYVPINSTKKFCNKEDIMIGRYGPPVFQILRGLEGAYNVALMKALPLVEMNSEYVFHLFSSHYLQNIIIGNSKRTAGQTGVNLKLLNSIEINVPPIELQKKFAEHIAIIEKQKNQVQASLEQSNNLFNSLLQKAFTGELTQH